MNYYLSLPRITNLALYMASRFAMRVVSLPLVVLSTLLCMNLQVPPPMGGPDHELWSNGHPTRGGPASIYSTMNHANYIGQARYTGIMGHDELHPVTVRC